MFENPGGGHGPLPPLPTPMSIVLQSGLCGGHSPLFDGFLMASFSKMTLSRSAVKKWQQNYDVTMRTQQSAYSTITHIILL